MHEISRRRFTVAVNAAAWSAALVPGLAEAQAITYDVIELGSTLPIDVTRNVWDVNAHNVAAGDCDLRPATFTANGAHAFLSDLPGTAVTINAAGDAAGFVGANGNQAAVVWRGGMQIPLAMPIQEPVLRSTAVKIDDQSRVYGYFSWIDASGQVLERGFKTNANLDVAIEGPWGGNQNLIRSANDQATMVGGRENIANGMTEGVRVDASGTVVSLAPLVGTPYAFATTINAAGDVAGSAGQSGSDADLGFVLIGGKRRDFGLRGSRRSLPLDINDAGVVVGTSYVGPRSRPRAVVWQRGRTIDISTLPEVLAAGWTNPSNAVAINNAGTIVGSGIRNGAAVLGAFMLVPRA